MHDRAGGHGRFMATIGALVEPPLLDPVILSTATNWTDEAVRPPDLEKVLFASLFSGEAPIELGQGYRLCIFRRHWYISHLSRTYVRWL